MRVKNILISLGSLVVFAVIIKLFSFSTTANQNNSPSKIKEDDSTQNQKAKDYNQYIKDNYKAFAIPLPTEITFAGETVPAQDIDVRERLDKEFTVNTFWHSQTFLFHKRANRYFPLIEKILAEQGVPDDFKYLALIESGLDNVKSPAGAAGFWQFMPSTGKGYGLEVNKYVDERYHLEKATYAACKYLLTAKKELGSWTLAAASYNMGKAGVKNRLKQQQAETYYDLRLNSETARYVFRIIAAKYILSNSEQYGFNLREEELYHPLKTKEISVDTTVNSLIKFSISQNTNYKIIKRMNPWLRSTILPNKSRKKYVISLPADEENMKPMNQY